MKVSRLLWSIIHCCALVCNAVSGQECEHRYTRQPPVTLNCNPFEATRLVMTCTAEGPRTPSFSVIWTRQRNGIDEVLHGSKIGIMIDATIVNISEILRRSSRLTVNGLSEVDDVGDCWCQVRLQNGTVLQKKSNILTLSSEAQYKGLGPCGGSQFVDKEDCIHPPQVTVPGVTDADTMTPISVQNSSNLFLTPQSTGAMEERDNKNLVSLYTGVAFTVLFCLLIVTLFTILVVLCKKKSCAFRFTTRAATLNSPHSVQLGLTASPVEQEESIDFRENVAYNTVGKITLKENVAYVSAVPSLVPEYEELCR